MVIFLFKVTSFILFILGILGIFIIKRNLIMVLVCIELLLVAVQLNFIISSYYFNDISGQIFILYILMAAAAEIAIGLALLIVYYRLRGTIESKHIYLTKG